MSIKIIVINGKKEKESYKSKRKSILDKMKQEFLMALTSEPDNRTVEEYQPTHSDILNEWLFS